MIKHLLSKNWSDAKAFLRSLRSLFWKFALEISVHLWLVVIRVMDGTDELAQEKSLKALGSSQAILESIILDFYFLTFFTSCSEKIEKSSVFCVQKCSIVFAALLNRNIWITIQWFKIFEWDLSSKRTFQGSQYSRCTAISIGNSLLEKTLVQIPFMLSLFSFTLPGLG